MGEIRKRITFHGRVQGVGFRYTARLAAGWAKNEYDGTVTMEVQGSEGMINKLLVRLNTDHFIRIEWMDSEEIPIREDEKGFQIKY